MKKRRQPIVTTKYVLSSKSLPTMRIALVADLHERDGAYVVDILGKEKPDLILAAGDILERCTPGESEYTQKMINEWQGYVNDGSLRYKFIRFLLHAGDFLHVRDQKFSGGMSFLEQISKIAPVYYGVGNHEWYFYPEDLEFFDKCGITLLDNRHTQTDFLSAQGPVQVGGLSTRHDLAWLDTFAAVKGSKILICHQPEYYKKFIRGTKRDTFDLIVSGHVHGGQLRIGKRGVLAPGQGFFPELIYGVYDDKLVISSGLSNTTSVPRWGNPMEVVIIDIIKSSPNQ